MLVFVFKTFKYSKSNKYIVAPTQVDGGAAQKDYRAVI